VLDTFFQDIDVPHDVCNILTARRAWHAHLGTTLRDNGFVLSISSTPMFLLHLPEVDEIVVFSSAATSRPVHRLCFGFAVNNLGPLDYFFGIKASYS
jgi:hypothetical protein